MRGIVKSSDEWPQLGIADSPVVVLDDEVV